MALTPFDMEGVNRDLLAAGNPAKPDMQSILRRNARDLVLGNAILVSSVDAKELEFGVHMAYSDADGGFDTDVALATGELSKLIPAVIAALGGEIEPGAALPNATETPAAKPAKPKQEAVTAIGDDDPPF